eukprot:g12389.t1
MLNREKRYIFYFFRENYNRGTNYQSLCLRPVSLLKSSDYIVLSDNPKTRASFTSSNCLYHNKVSERQVIWVPQTLYDHPHLHETVLDSVKKHVQSDLSTYQLVPYIVTKALREIGSKYKLKILGDSLEHVPSKDAIMNVHFSKKMLRTPPIFLVEDLNDILTTYGQAVEASNNPVFLLKCAHTQGGAGIFKIRSKKDLLQALQSEHLRRLKDEINVADASSYGAFSKFKLYFEQFIDNNLGTIVVTCFGDKMLCVTEQLQSTYTHIGNSFPISSKFKLNYEFLEMEVSTISKKFKLRGPWGMDLVASKDIDNSPIFYLVDINCGRFNGRVNSIASANAPAVAATHGVDAILYGIRKYMLQKSWCLTIPQQCRDAFKRNIEDRDQFSEVFDVFLPTKDPGDMVSKKAVMNWMEQDTTLPPWKKDFCTVLQKFKSKGIGYESQKVRTIGGKRVKGWFTKVKRVNN